MLHLNFSLNLTLYFDGMIATKRENKLQDWMNLSRVLQMENDMIDDQIVGIVTT